MPIGRLAARVRDRRAEAQPYKGMSQTKVKSRMYASKFPTERSPVAKCVMIVVVDRVNKLLKEWGVSPALPARTRYVLIEIDDISPNKLASIEEVEIQSAAWGD